MKQRIVTGVVAGSGFFVLLLSGGYWYAGIVMLMAAIGYIEYARMNGFRPTGGISLFGTLATLYLAFPWSSFIAHRVPGFETAVWIVLFALFLATVVSKNRITIDRIALALLGVVYLGAGFHYIAATRYLEDGLYWTLFLFACIWSADSGAYFSGRLFGKRLLWPEISPKKTVEGAIGGVVCSVVAALCFFLYAPERLGLGQAVALGLVVSVVSQLGDLIQSAYKRVRGIKDTGAILPGHGGVLDRCDSWLIVFPFVHLLALLPPLTGGS